MWQDGTYEFGAKGMHGVGMDDRAGEGDLGWYTQMVDSLTVGLSYRWGLKFSYST